MTALSIINMRQSQRYHDELNSGNLNKLEKLAVRLEVARGLQKQTGWGDIVRKGEAMEENVLDELIEVCLTDPAHIETSACAELDGSDNSVSGQWSEHGYY